MKMKLLIAVITMLFTGPTFAADQTIEMLNKDENGNRMVFSQELAEVGVGDTITWVPTDKGHNVEIVASPDGMKFKSKNGKEAKIKFKTPGVYYYWCTPHKGMGMIGLVVVGGDTSNKAMIAKAKSVGKSKKKLKMLLTQIK
jgi:pseudoazurin